MSNTYTGTGGASGLEVRTFDLATDLFGIDIIEVSNGTLGPGASPNIARITIGGGGGGGVTTISFGTTGLTPAGVTAGAVTVAGTLVAANGGTSFSTYATGDLIYASAANTLAKLAAGANGEVLTLAAGVPSWAASTGGIGGTIAATQVAYGTAADTIGGDASLIFDVTTQTFTVGGTEPSIRVHDATDNYVIVLDAQDPAGTGGVKIKMGVTTASDDSYLSFGAYSSKNNLDTQSRDFHLFGGSGDLAYWDQSTGNMGVGRLYDNANLPPNTLTVGDSDAGTTTVLYPVRISRISTGTAAVGLGVGLEFESEGPAQAGVNYVGSIIESVSAAGTTAGNTRYDMVLKNYNGAAASEVARFTSNGGFTTTSSVAAGTTVSVNPDAGGTVTVGGTGGVSTTNGPISAGGATGAVSANTTVTGGTGVVATTGGVLASAGGVTATLGNITAAAGNIGATAGSVSAGTTVTGGTGVVATTGNVAATAGAVTAGTSVSATTTVAAGTTVTAGTNLLAPGGGVTVGQNVTASLGNILATVGYSSQIGGQIFDPAGAAVGGADLSTPLYFGAVTTLAADTYTLSSAAAPGATATFITPNAVATVVVDGVGVTSVTGGGATGTAFTCPQFDSFTIYFTAPTTAYVFGNVTVS